MKLSCTLSRLTKRAFFQGYALSIQVLVHEQRPCACCRQVSGLYVFCVPIRHGIRWLGAYPRDPDVCSALHRLWFSLSHLHCCARSNPSARKRPPSPIAMLPSCSAPSSCPGRSCRRPVPLTVPANPTSRPTHKTPVLAFPYLMTFEHSRQP